MLHVNIGTTKQNARSTEEQGGQPFSASMRETAHGVVNLIDRVMDQAKRVSPPTHPYIKTTKGGEAGLDLDRHVSFNSSFNSRPQPHSQTQSSSLPKPFSPHDTTTSTVSTIYNAAESTARSTTLPPPGISQYTTSYTTSTTTPRTAPLRPPVVPHSTSNSFDTKLPKNDKPISSAPIHPSFSTPASRSDSQFAASLSHGPQSSLPATGVQHKSQLIANNTRSSTRPLNSSQLSEKDPTNFDSLSTFRSSGEGSNIDPFVSKHLNPTSPAPAELSSFHFIVTPDGRPKFPPKSGIASGQSMASYSSPSFSADQQFLTTPVSNGKSSNYSSSVSTVPRPPLLPTSTRTNHNNESRTFSSPSHSPITSQQSSTVDLSPHPTQPFAPVVQPPRTPISFAYRSTSQISQATTGFEGSTSQPYSPVNYFSSPPTAPPIILPPTPSRDFHSPLPRSPATGVDLTSLQSPVNANATSINMSILSPTTPLQYVPSSGGLLGRGTTPLHPTSHMAFSMQSPSTLFITPLKDRSNDSKFRTDENDISKLNKMWNSNF
jgi:hypothetical protein